MICFNRRLIKISGVCWINVLYSENETSLVLLCTIDIIYSGIYLITLHAITHPVASF